ncbi:MAG: biotin/lipoyl-containing protein, partial [Polyangiales bacterium]
MAKIIGLPKLSPTMEEGTLVSWAKKEGDAVDVDDLLAEVETDKATMEFRSFDKGVLLKILVDEGVTLEAEVPVAIIGKEGEDISDLLAEVEAGASAKPSAAPSKAEAKADPEPDSKGDAESETEPEAAATDPGSAAPASQGSDRVISSPLVRRLARQRDIDLALVPGSGPHGRIVKRDLDSYEG